MRIAVFFIGELHDAGFNASALAGVRNATDAGLAEIEVVCGVPYDQPAIRLRMADVLARNDGLVFVGGQGDKVTPDLAAACPDKRFAIVQGRMTGPNLASYDVRQEESAFLAGCLAAEVTRSGTVGHLSGHRVRPGLKGRAAFVAGVRHTDPEIRVLTGFCGTQDDNAVAGTWTAAEIEEGADVIFTMLNGARQGAIDACRSFGVRQIGNALDWVAGDEEVFVGSAIARIDLGVERAISDMASGHVPTEIAGFGLADGDYVALSTAPSVPTGVTVRIKTTARLIREGEIVVPDNYDGPEFRPNSVTCASTA